MFQLLNNKLFDKNLCVENLLNIYQQYSQQLVILSFFNLSLLVYIRNLLLTYILYYIL